MDTLTYLYRDLARLELLDRDGKDESPEADAIRDGMDATWLALDDAGRAEVEQQSIALRGMDRAEVERLARDQ